MTTYKQEHQVQSRTLRGITQVGTDVTETADKINLVDFVISVFMFAIGIAVPLLPIPLPLGAFATLLLVLIAVFRKPLKIDISPKIGLFTGVMMISIIVTLISSTVFGISTNSGALRRAFRIVIVIFFALLLARRVIDFRSVIYGLATGLVVNAIAFYAGVAPDNYSGTLSGWLNDKNQAGLWYAAIGLLFVGQIKRTHYKILTGALFFGFVWLTASRTSLAAYGFGILWMLFARRLNIVFKLGLATFIVWLIDYITINYARVGVFSNRVGSDELRERIDSASLEKLDITPWHGLGFGQAYVDLQNRTFFFHNSFWSLFVEGGYLWLIVVVALTIFAGFLWKQSHEKRRSDAEACLVLLLICSWRLGEVFLTVPWALAIGIALSYLSSDPSDKETEQPSPKISSSESRCVLKIVC